MIAMMVKVACALPSRQSSPARVTVFSCSRDNVLQLPQCGTRSPNATTSTTLKRQRLLLLTLKPIPEILEIHDNWKIARNLKR